MDARADPEIASSAKRVFSAGRKQREHKLQIITRCQCYQAGPGSPKDESTLPPTCLIPPTLSKFARKFSQKHWHGRINQAFRHALSLINPPVVRKHNRLKAAFPKKNVQANDFGPHVHVRTGPQVL